MSQKDIDACLAGELSYDDLDESDQALVHSIWMQRAEERRLSLDLVSEFRAKGEQYSTMEDGKLVRYVAGDAEREYVDERGIIVKVYVRPTEG